MAGDGRFKRLDCLGRGTSGVVYRVLDEETGLEVALKTLATANPENLYRLKQEFRALAEIRHRNLVELYELHVEGESCFFTMELVDGVDLVSYVAAAGPGRPALPTDAGAPASRIERCLAAARQLVSGLVVLHGAGKLHRDVKPSNILVDRNHRVVLLDFGFVTAAHRSALAQERSSGAAGSLAYMAPEILRGHEPTQATDWYSVGVALYEALGEAFPGRIGGR